MLLSLYTNVNKAIYVVPIFLTPTLPNRRIPPLQAKATERWVDAMREGQAMQSRPKSQSLVRLEVRAGISL